MSQLDSTNVTCPNCDTQQVVDYWTTINVTIDPELKTQLFEGQLNKFTCRKCNEIFQLDSSLLYHDMDRKIAVWYVPESSIDDDEAVAAFAAPEKEELVETLEDLADYLAHPHMVFDMNELRRQVRWFERVHEEKVKKDQTG